MPNTLTKRGGTRAVVAAARMPALADEGIAVAIVAVTGTEDSVKDVISPGAFAQTLKKRRPKFCWMHDWKIPLGRVLSIVELKPGDPRLPKVLPDGRSWPAKAGALVATVQFNLKTQNGREFFEFAKQWQLNGEAAFSIGYRVIDGMSSKRADGVRVIFGLDLYEVSLVLHGAHDMALTLEVKDASAVGDGVPELEHKDTDGLIEMPEQPDFDEHSMVALYPDPDVAEAVAVAGGLPPEDLHVTVAYLGQDPIGDPQALVDALTPAVAAVGPLEGTIGGLGMFPPGENGTPAWVPVDVRGLDALRTAVVDTLEGMGQPIPSEHGFTPHMTLGYDLPDQEPLPSRPVTFTEAVLVIGKDRYPIPLSSAAPAAEPAPEPAPAPAPAPLEAKAAVLHLSRLAGRDGAVALLEAKSAPIPTPPPAPSRLTPLEKKSMNYMKGSQEELRGALNRAVEDLLVPVQKNSGGSDTEPEGMGGWACVDATFADHVIATRHSGRGPDETFKIDYTFDGENVALGKPSKVELSLVAVPDPDDPAPTDLEESPDVRLRFIDPATAFISDAAKYVGASPEGKGLEQLTDPLMRLLDALAVKGYDVAGAVMGELGDGDLFGDEEDDPAEVEPDGDADDARASDEEEDPAEVEPDGDEDDADYYDDEDDVPDEDPAPAPAYGGEADDVEPDEDEDDETITLDPETVHAQMASLRV